jgi:DnaA N-terminal domain
LVRSGTGVKSNDAPDGLTKADDQMQRLERGVWWMSRQAIAAVLARTDLASGERLVAFSLTSFAGRENRAWPGAPAASARAGLSRSRYQQARERLVTRRLLAVDERATGRGRASTVTLVFADTGPWWDGDINVELFDAVLTYSRTRGPERLLLATMAAVADEEGAVHDLSTEQLRDAAGIADRTYRRARTALLASGLVELVNGVGGRGNTNVWIVRDPREIGNAVPSHVPRRVAPPAGARPLIASTVSPGAAAQVDEPGAVAVGKGGHDRTVPAGKGPILAEVSAQKGGHDRTVTAEKCPILTGVSDAKEGQDQTLFDLAPTETPAQTPAKTPAETPAPNARTGREPLNPRTGEDPPSPPEGGSPPDSILVEETFVTARGRTRRRPVRIDLNQVRRGLGIAGFADRNDWDQICKRLRELVGESMFEIWLEPLELIAIDPSGTLVIDAPPAAFSWLRHRYGRVIARCAEEASRAVRFAEEPERHAFARERLAPPSAVRAVHTNQREVSQ